MRIRLSTHLFAILCLIQVSVFVTGSELQTLPSLATPFAAPDFELMGEDGRTYRLADFRGKVVLINFWATWCPPCRYEIPAFERLWQQVRGKGIVILAVNVGESRDTIFEFMGQYPMSFPLPMDIQGEVVKAYPVTGLPTTYIVSPQGLVTHRVIGSREWDDPALIQRLLELRN